MRRIRTVQPCSGRHGRPSRQGFTWDALGRRIAHSNDALGITTRYFFDGVSTLDATGDSVADHEVGERRAFAVVSRASELVEYADNGTGNGLRSRYPALDAQRRALPPCRRRECRAFAACQG
jgi:YD repeat-containing protein